MATVLDIKSADKVQSRRLWVSAGGGKRGRGRKRGQLAQDFAHRLGVGRGRGGLVVKPQINGSWQHDDRFEGGMGMHPDNDNDQVVVVKGRGNRRYMPEGAPPSFNAPIFGAPGGEREAVVYGDL